jgi:hypothetical protein
MPVPLAKKLLGELAAYPAFASTSGCTIVSAIAPNEIASNKL